MYIISSNTAKQPLIQLYWGMCFKYTKRFLGLLHQTAKFTNYQKFSFTLQELRDVDKCKVVITPYFREKSEKCAKMRCFLRFSQNVNLTFPKCYNKKEAMIFFKISCICAPEFSR